MKSGPFVNGQDRCFKLGHQLWRMKKIWHCTYSLITAKDFCPPRASIYLYPCSTTYILRFGVCFYRFAVATICCIYPRTYTDIQLLLPVRTSISLLLNTKTTVVCRTRCSRDGSTWLKRPISPRFVKK
jgi:hypothetical protein